MVPLLKKALPFLTAAFLAAAAYDGWLFYSRWHDARQTERAARAQEAADARRVIDLLGGGKLKILSFYASPSAKHRGEHATVCYGVIGAKRVWIEPKVEELHPALSHCFQVSPSQSSEYKLVAVDDAGHTVTQGLALAVAP